MKIDRFVEKFDDTKKIKQSNKLVEAKYKLSLTECKILFAVLSQIAKSGSGFERVRVSAAALIEFCRLPKTRGYSMLKAACCSLRSRVVHIKIDAKKWYMTGFINSAYYHDGVIDFTFDEKLKDYMLNIEQAYLSADAKMICTFKSDLAVRLYLLLKKAVKISEIEYSINFIRERFMLAASYANISHFRTKFLARCVAEINEKSDINVNYELIKSKKSYTKVKFIISAKTKKAEKKQLTSSCDELKLNDEEKAAFDKLTACEVMSKRAIELIKNHSAERCSAFVDLFKRKKEKGEEIGAGLLISLIEDENEQIPLLESKKKQNEEVIEKIRADYSKQLMQNSNQNSIFKKMHEDYQKNA